MNFWCHPSLNQLVWTVPSSFITYSIPPPNSAIGPVPHSSSIQYLLSTSVCQECAGSRYTKGALIEYTLLWYFLKKSTYQMVHSTKTYAFLAAYYIRVSLWLFPNKANFLSNSVLHRKSPVLCSSIAMIWLLYFLYSHIYIFLPMIPWCMENILMLIMIFFLLKSNIKHVRNERKVIFYIISVIFYVLCQNFFP